MKKQWLGVALVAAAVLAGCGGGGDKAGETPFGPNDGSASGTGGGNNSGTVTGNSQATLVLGITPADAKVSASNPGVVTAVVKDAAGNPIDNVIVRFSVDDTSLATVSPASVLVTRVNGQTQAQTTVTPVQINGTGATNVIAEVTLSNGSLAARIPVSISPTNITLDSASPAAGTIAAYASTSINFSLTGVSSAVPATIRVSSTCASQNRASITPSSQTLTQGIGSVTYKDNGCGTTDRVVVSLDGTSQTRAVDIVVNPTATTGIQFDSASPDTICLAGSGCAATSIVKFKVVDQNGLPKPGETVFFSIDQPESASLSAVQGSTDVNGFASVSVNANTRPGPVRVTGDVKDGSGAVIYTTVSSALSVNAGRPVQRGFDFSAGKYALNFDLSGDSTTISMIVSDRFSNPVPDGTAVSFVAEGGTVVPASCQTSGGTCNVQFKVSDPRPADGRVALVAFAQGEENFTDLNNNGTFDTGEFTAVNDDLGEVFLDKDENGTMDAGEKVIGNVKNGSWDSNNYVRRTPLFTFSRTAIRPRLFEYDSMNDRCSTTAYTPKVVSLAATCRQQVVLCVKDGNTSADNKTNGDGSVGNPLASGSQLAVSTNATGAKVSIDNSPTPSSPAGPSRHVIVIERQSCGTAPTAGGDVDLTISTGNSSYTFNTAATVTN